jgi:hypothetical protein
MSKLFACQAIFLGGIKIFSLSVTEKKLAEIAKKTWRIWILDGKEFYRKALGADNF